MQQGQARLPQDLGLSELMRLAQCRVAEGEAFEDVCRLRYEAYRREGALPEGAVNPFSDRFDLEPNATTYGFYIDGGLVCSMRIHVVDRDSPEHPALHVFPDHIMPLIEAGETLIDPTRFVIDYNASRLYPKVSYLALRLVYLACVWFDADRLLATVRPEHQAFYKRFSGHRLVCPARPYPSLTKPLSLMILDHRVERMRLLARHPYFVSTNEEMAAMFGDTSAAKHYSTLVA